MTLEDLGWNAAFAAEFAPYHREGWKPARLIRGRDPAPRVAEIGRAQRLTVPREQRAERVGVIQ